MPSPSPLLDGLHRSAGREARDPLHGLLELGEALPEAGLDLLESPAFDSLGDAGYYLSVSGTVSRTTIMRARKLIDGAAFGPDALKAIGEAFDAAWAEIGGNFGNVPADIDNARFRLATALLSIASEDSRDVEVLKRAALQRMALDYRSQ